MAKKAKRKDNKNLIIGICSAVVVLVVIIVAVVLATSGSSRLNDSYFVSDDTKYVLTIESEESTGEDSQYIPIKTHMVYTYEGDAVTGLTAYYEYSDEATAKEAKDYLASTGIEYKEIYTDGKYVVIVANDSDYADMTASDVKSQIEFMEMLKNMNVDEGTTTEDAETTGAGETVEVTESETEE